MSWRTTGTFLGFLVAALASPVLEAGSIFMKNGYIIHASIVDRDDASIVLGWNNGKVTIARRFIESIVFDPTEEQQLRELNALRREIAGAAAVAMENVGKEGGGAEDLPPTLEGFMATYNLGPSPTALDGLNDVPGVVEPVTPVATIEALPAEDVQGDTEVSGEDGELVIVAPPQDTPERFEDAARGVSLRLPVGWVPMARDDALVVSGGTDAAGFRASLNIVALDAGSLLPSEYALFLKDEQARLLSNFELLEEGARETDGYDAFFVISRGTYEGRQAVVQQRLVARGERLWLLSGFSSQQDAEGDFGVIGEALDSVVFADQ